MSQTTADSDTPPSQRRSLRAKSNLATANLEKQEEEKKQTVALAAAAAEEEDQAAALSDSDADANANTDDDATDADNANTVNVAPNASHSISCPDFVWYETVHWSDPGRTTLLLLPKSDYEYWHYRLNLYLCNTWGDVRTLGKAVYEDAVERFRDIHQDDGYDFEDGSDIFDDDDIFDAWDDLYSKGESNINMMSYPYSISKIMYEDTHHGGFVPRDIKVFGHTKDKDVEASEFFVKDKFFIFDLISRFGGTATREPGLQDFLIAEALRGSYAHLEDTAFIEELWKKKTTLTKYSALRGAKAVHSSKRAADDKANKKAKKMKKAEVTPPKAKKPTSTSSNSKKKDNQNGEAGKNDGPKRFSDWLIDSEGNEYDYAPLPKNGAKHIKPGTRLLCCFTSGWDIGRVCAEKRYSKGQLAEAKKMKCPILVKYDSDGMYWLHDMGLREAPYLPSSAFKLLARNRCTDKELGVKAGFWCCVTRKKNSAKSSK